MARVRIALIWAALALALAVPIAAAAASPLLAWRQPIYIVAGFAGIVALALLLVQPLLAGGHVPGLRARLRLQVHRWVGATLVLAVVIHVAALWITSPPDVVDALLFVSPTPFSVWGVLAMWAVFATACLAVLRRRLRLSSRAWRLGHTGLAALIASGSIAHALLIEGTMETLSKVLLCFVVLIATATVVANVWRGAVRSRRTF